MFESTLFLWHMQIFPLKLFKLLKLFPLKICISANFVVPLQPIPTLEGICPAKSVSQRVFLRVGFWHIKIAFIDALRLTIRKLRNFSNTVKIKVISRCLWVWLYPCYISFGCSVSSYQRRFPVVYLTVWAMRRPLIVSEQRRSTLFFASYCL